MNFSTIVPTAHIRDGIGYTPIYHNLGSVTDTSKLAMMSIGGIAGSTIYAIMRRSRLKDAPSRFIIGTICAGAIGVVSGVLVEKGRKILGFFMDPG